MNAEALRTKIFSELLRPDRTGLPKYQRLSNVLVQAIKHGLWQPGDRLPAEDELTEMTPFSLGTVQRALRDLTDQGLVVRQHGLGNFVADQQRRLQDPWHCRFVGDDGVGILPIYSKAVQRVVMNETGPWTQYLGTDSSNIMRLDRIINVDDEFKIFSRFYANRLLLKRLWDSPLEQLDGANFKEIIARQAKLPITDIDRLVRIDSIDAEAAQWIQVKAAAQVLFMQAIAHAGRDMCVYYQEFYIPQSNRSLQFPEETPKSSRH